MQVLYGEGVASPHWPRAVRRVPRGARRSVGRGSRAGWPLSRERALSRAPTGLPTRKATRVAASSRAASRPGVVRDPSMHGRSLHGNREISSLAGGSSAPPVRVGKATRPKPAMNGDEKSDPAIVAVKPANEAGQPGDGVGGAKGGGRGERGRSARGPGTASGRPVIGDRPRTQSRTREERGKVHHPAAPHRRGAAAPSLSLAEAGRGAWCGRDDVGCLRRGAGRRGYATLRAASIEAPTGHSRAYVPTSRNRTAGNGRSASRRWRTRLSSARW